MQIVRESTDGCPFLFHEWANARGGLVAPRGHCIRIPLRHIFSLLAYYYIKMSYLRLSSLGPAYFDGTICVRVVRLWLQRGGLETGPAKFIHVVVVCDQGHSMYGRMEASSIPHLNNVLRLGGIYEISRFCVSYREHRLKPVKTPYALVFSSQTRVTEIYPAPPNLPQMVYNLTDLTDLPDPRDQPRHLIDVLGIITTVSDLGAFDVVTRETAVLRRDVYIRNLNGYEVKLFMVGETAHRFRIENLRYGSPEQTVVAIFTGALVKQYNGRKVLYGSTSMGWILDRNVGEIRNVYSRLRGVNYPVGQGAPPERLLLRPRADETLISRSIEWMMNYDFFVNQDAYFSCTVTIAAFSQDHPWWCTTCSQCGWPSIPDEPFSGRPTTYTCVDRRCYCRLGVYRYKIYADCFDGKDNALFILSDAVATQMIGSSVHDVLQNIQPDNDVSLNVRFCVRQPSYIPQELLNLIGETYTFSMKETPSNFDGEKTCFPVISARLV